MKIFMWHTGSRSTILYRPDNGAVNSRSFQQNNQNIMSVWGNKIMQGVFCNNGKI